jgi:hypothetical protein
MFVFLLQLMFVFQHLQRAMLYPRLHRQAPRTQRAASTGARKTPIGEPSGLVAWVNLLVHLAIKKILRDVNIVADSYNPALNTDSLRLISRGIIAT